jgi:cbb3-type cytochrome oxidase maturation protein
MTVLFVVLPLALVFSGLAVVAFLWSVGSAQLEDLDTPPLRALTDDAPVGSGPRRASLGARSETST